MTLGIFDLFRIGIGPSSSHTVGPMLAARAFAEAITAGPHSKSVRRVRVHLYGSLAATGQGHGTPGAVILGLEGESPDTLDLTHRERRLTAIAATGSVRLGGAILVDHRPDDIVMHPLTILPGHPNGMRCEALDAAGDRIAEDTYYSVGGGSILREGETLRVDQVGVPHPFGSADELIAMAESTDLTIAELTRQNEVARYGESALHDGVDRILAVMLASVTAGLRTRGILPGGLGVTRRAPGWYRSMADEGALDSPLAAMDWLNLVALAVNEENAAGRRMVTAPTNGAAGIVPAVLHHAVVYAAPRAMRRSVAETYLLTATAVGSIVKERASVSGAEVGCQGEVGSASAMAAAGLAQVLGGTPRQVTNAAEIAMEHNLGLTCDPVGGLVQIPCIERNAVGAVQAMNAATIAMRGDGTHLVSLDEVIETMRQTGLDMNDKYKETSRGGLAVNVPEC